MLINIGKTKLLLFLFVVLIICLFVAITGFKNYTLSDYGFDFLTADEVLISNENLYRTEILSEDIIEHLYREDAILELMSGEDADKAYSQKAKLIASSKKYYNLFLEKKKPFILYVGKYYHNGDLFHLTLKCHMYDDDRQMVVIDISPNKSSFRYKIKQLIDWSRGK